MSREIDEGGNTCSMPAWCPPLADMRARGFHLSSQTGMIFNAVLAAAAISSMSELHLFDEMKGCTRLSIEEFCGRHRVDAATTRSLLGALEQFEIVRISSCQQFVIQGRYFSEAYGDKGYFLWLMNGYGYLWQHLGELLAADQRGVNSIGRSGKHIALAGWDYGANFVDPYFFDVLEALSFRVIADIGCGSAERLLNILERYPTVCAVGIDVNADALEVARQRAQERGLQDRVTLMHADLRDMRCSTVLENIDVITSFFMGHDLWPRESCLALLNRLPEIFPKLRRFILCDTFRSPSTDSPIKPIFTRGFEISHAMMNQYIPTVTDWQELFADSRWMCIERRDIAIPFSCIFDLRL
jgi:SAM-dependent methyltransferase